MLLAVRLAQKCGIILFAKLEQSVQGVYDYQAVNINNNNDDCDDSVAKLVLLGFEEKPSAESDVGQNVDGGEN